MSRAHELNLQVIPWTINEVDRMEKLLDWQVDGLITDYPDRARKVLEQRGLSLPHPVL